MNNNNNDGIVKYVRPINHMKHDYDACMPFQWVREVTKNGEEAGATRVEFEIEWQAVKRKNVYRRTIFNNGKAIEIDNFLSYFCGVGEGGKDIGGEHDNFGVGIKISLYPWNPDGIVIITYKDNVGHMIKIYFDENDDNFKAKKFGNTYVKKLGKKELDEDGIDWAAIAPDWIRQQGTAIVLLGSEKYPDTILGDQYKGEDKNIWGIIATLNSRYWSLPVKLRVVQLPQDRKTWPRSFEESQKSKLRLDKYVRGAKYYAEQGRVKGKEKGSLKDSGIFYIDQNRVLVGWFLWEGEISENHQAIFGYIAALYKNELYDIKNGRHSHRSFGIMDEYLRKRVTLIFEPAISDGSWGVSPHKSRSKLLFVNGPNNPKRDLPWDLWAKEFAINMPESIQEEVLKNMNTDFDVEDEKLLERLGSKISERINAQEELLIITKGTGYSKSTQKLKYNPITTNTQKKPNPNPNPNPNPSNRDRPSVITKKIPKGIIAKEDPNGAYGAKKVHALIDMPKGIWDTNGKVFSEDSTSAATWQRNYSYGRDGVHPTIILNPKHIFFKVTIEELKKKWPYPTAENSITKITNRVIRNLAITQVANICKTFSKLPEKELDEKYFSDDSLTQGLAGLIAIEDFIIHEIKTKLKLKEIK